MLQELMRDLRLGLRMLARSPGFTILALIIMGVGIGANTALFSAVNGVLLKPLPYPEAERIVLLRENNLPRGWTSFSIAPLNFWDWQQQNRSMELMAAYRTRTVTYTGGDRPETVSAYQVSEQYLQIMGGEPVLGRGLNEEDMTPNREGVVLLDYGFWEQSFGGDPEVLGTSMVLDGEPHTIIGVLPQGWRPLSRSGLDIVLPLRPEPWWFEARGSHFLRGVGRVRSDATVEQAQADLSSVAAALEAEYPDSNSGWGASVRRLDDVLLEEARPQLLILLASVGLVLLIACVNVAQMTLARASARGQEMAIRAALGAGRVRVVRQLLAESLLLSSFGGALGVLIAIGCLKGLLVGWPEILPRMQEISVDGTVLWFTAGLSLASALLFGLFPALSIAGSNLAEALRSSARSVSADVSLRRLRGGLVVVEVSLAVILLVGSGLLVRSFLALQSEDPGFETGGRLALSTRLPDSKYPTREDVQAYGDATLERLAAIPGVESVAITTLLPVTGQDEIWGLEIEGRPQDNDDRISALLYRVSAGYLETMGIPLRMGREFTADDREGSIMVSVVSESFARQHFQGENPVGRRIRFGGEGSPFVEIVGVAGDVQHYEVGRTSMPQTYLPFAQWPDDYVSFVLKASVPPLSLVRAVRAEIQSVDPDMPLAGVRTYEQIVSADMSSPRFRTMLLTSFGLIALLLAVVGLYGVMSYTVAQRSREIGTRMALGARQGNILRLVFRDGVPLVAAGVVVGLGGALALARALESILFGVSVNDPVVFVAVPSILVAVAAVAMLIPALRATRVDPLRVLSPE
jgi:putative ABC transport system permease protein